MITCYICANKIKLNKIKDIKVSNLIYPVCGKCFDVWDYTKEAIKQIEK